MDTKDELDDSLSDGSYSEPDDLITAQGRLNFSSSSIGPRDDNEFWSKTRKEMIQPSSSVPERTSSAPSLSLNNEEHVDPQDSTMEAAVSELVASIDEYRSTLMKGSIDEQAEVLLIFRKKLTDPQLCPLIAARLFDSDIVHLLLDIFAVHTEWKLQFNALICLKEMCAYPTEQTPALSIVRTMLELLDTSNIIEVIEVVLVILGHMTQDEHSVIRTRNMRHLILNHNVLNRVASIVIDCHADKLIPAVAWLASTLIEDPMPNNVSSLLGDDFIYLLMRMSQHPDVDTQSNALCALTGVVECYKFSWDLIVQSNPMLPSFLGIIGHPDLKIALWGLKIFGNITSTDDEPIMHTLIDLGIVQLLRPLTTCTTPTIRLWVAFALSNILTGMASHVDLLIKIDIASALVTMAEQEAKLQETEDPKFEYQVIVNAACALANALANTNGTQARTLIGQRVLESITRALGPTQPEYVLEAIVSSIMHVMTEADPLDIISICSRLEKCGTAERLRSISNHPNSDLVDNINEIIRALNTIKFTRTTATTKPKDKTKSSGKEKSSLPSLSSSTHS